MEGEQNDNKQSDGELNAKGEPLSSQVLEYYQKYSQNRHLPKYFSGPAVPLQIGDWHSTPKTVINYNSSNLPSTSTNEDVIELSASQTWTDLLAINTTCTSEPFKESNVLIQATSPSSSITSNRKLEWDNGADIGYSNVTTKTLQKSISLPVLCDTEYEKLQKSLFALHDTRETDIVNNPLKSEKNNQNSLELCGDDISCASIQIEEPCSLTKSSSLSGESKQKEKHSLSDSELSKNYIQFFNPKISLPVAESTRNQLIDYSETLTEATSFIKSSSSSQNSLSIKLKDHSENQNSINLNMIDQVSYYKNLKVLKLTTAKPIIVDCINTSVKIRGKNEFVQTSLPKNASIAIQTDFSFKNDTDILKPVKKYTSEKQNVVYIVHSDSDKETNTQTSSTQTSSAVLSCCESFEYVRAAAIDKDKTNLEVVSKNEENLSPDVFSNLKRCPPKSDLRQFSSNSDKPVKGSQSSEITSNESPLGHLLSYKQQGQLIPDLEKKIELLQKVIQSKKYNNVTKKFYLKKIVKKLIDNKYSSDSTHDYDTYVENSEKSENKVSAGSLKSDKEPSRTTSNFDLQQNRPWKPIQDIENISTVPEMRRPLARKLEAQTFINEILPNIKDNIKEKLELTPTCSNFVPIQNFLNRKDTRLQRNRFLTLKRLESVPAETVASGENKSEQQQSSNSTENELYNILSAEHILTDNDTKSKSRTSDEITDIEIQSWRENKTRSEHLLDQKNENSSLENKDHLVSFAKKERQHQLYWINNEISHLSKLKELLEQRNDQKIKTETNDLHTFLQKPHVEDMQGVTKSTTVYVLTTEKRNRPKTATLSSTHQSPLTNNIKNSKNSKNSQYSCRKCENLLSEKTEASSLIKNNTLVEVGNEKINFKNARLVSSEQFTTNQSGTERKTIIHRYTFEIPIELNSSLLDDQPQTFTKSKDTCNCKPKSPPEKVFHIQEVNEQPIYDQKTHTQTATRRLTHELTINKNNLDKKQISKEATTATSPCCKCDKNTQCSPTCNKTTSSSESLTEVELSPDSSSTSLCRCCKKQSVVMPEKSTAQIVTEKYYLCYPCYNYNQVVNCSGTPYYTYPGHVCKCHEFTRSSTIQEIKNTVQELEKIEKKDAFCNCNNQKADSNSKYCSRCKCKIESKHKKKKGGMAYILTLEPDDDVPRKYKKVKENAMQEIKIKVPTDKSRLKDKKQCYGCCGNCNSSNEESGKENMSSGYQDCSKRDKHDKPKTKSKRPTLQVSR